VYKDLEVNLGILDKFKKIIEPIQKKYERRLDELNILKIFYLKCFISACKKEKKEKMITTTLKELKIDQTDIKDIIETTDKAKKLKNKGKVLGKFHLFILDEKKREQLLLEFKEENMDGYSFFIPDQYKITQQVKTIGEIEDPKTQNIIKFLSNFSIEIKTINKDTHWIFEDGCKLSKYFNQDVTIVNTNNLVRIILLDIITVTCILNQLFCSLSLKQIIALLNMQADK
jgi:hypothetical protein